MWLEMNKCLVNPDGQVIPCCYMANSLFTHLTALKSGNEHIEMVQWNKDPTLKKYIENKEDYNLNDNNIDDILSSDWFNKDLPESWDSYDTVPYVCKIWCDKKKQ